MKIQILLLILANVIVTYKGLNDFTFFNKNKFHIGAIESGDKKRFFTSGFLHADWSHLFLNMLTLYFFSPTILYTLGDFSFLVIYFGGLFLGNYISYKIHFKDKNYSAIGASGAVLSVVYASILLQPHSKIYLYFLLEMPAYVFGLLYLLYSIYGMKRQNDGIGHSAHFGGALAGYICICLFSFYSIIEHFYIALLLLIPFLVVFIFGKSKIF